MLARDVVSDVDWPPFDTSAMDGYAVRLPDVAGAGSALAERAGVVAAGDAPRRRSRAGEAVRVMTGRRIPEGTEAIVPVERARREAAASSSRSSRARRSHSPPGREHRGGPALLAARPAPDAGRRRAGGPGRRRPRLGLPAAARRDRGHRKRARRRSAKSRGPARSATPTARCSPLSAASRGWAAVARADGRGRGRRPRAPVRRRRGEHEDVLVTSGGVSAGDFDLLPAAAARQGFEILFHGVAMRPGKTDRLRPPRRDALVRPARAIPSRPRSVSIFSCATRSPASKGTRGPARRASQRGSRRRSRRRRARDLSRRDSRELRGEAASTPICAPPEATTSARTGGPTL